MAEREKIRIFELDIDIDAAIKSTASMKTEADKLKATYDELRKSTDASNEEIVKAKGAYDAANREYRTAQREVEKLTSLEGKQIKTIQEARNALSVVSSQWAKQADLYGANSKEADALAKKKLELTERLKTMEKATGDTSRNVGNYTESMKDAIQQSGIWQKTQSAANDVAKVAGPIITFISTGLHDATEGYKEATAGAKSYTLAQRAMNVVTAAGTAALKVFKVALISTGIGAVVVLLGSLVAWFSKTQDGIDLVNKVLAQMGAAFDVVIERAAMFGEGIMKLFSGDIRGGLDNLKNSFKGIGDEVAREVSLVTELQNATNELRRQEMDLIQTQAARRKQVEELRILAKDEETDLQERARLLQQAGDIEEQILQDQLRIAKERARISQLDTDRALSTDEELAENERLQARVIELETESLKKRRALESERQSLMKRARAQEEAEIKALEAEGEKAYQARIEREKKATEEALKESNLRLQIFIEENKGRAKTLEESLAYEQEVSDKRLAILEEELEAGKLNHTEYELAVLQTKNAFLDRQTQLTKEHAQKEIEAEKERLAQLQEIEAQERERKLVDLENRMLIEEENFMAQMELEKQRLDMMRQQELAEAEKTGADLTLIHQKYAKINEQIDYELQMARRDHAQHTFGEIAKLLGEQTVAGKAAAIAQATINTYQGVTEVWRSPSVLPEPFATIQKLVSTGTVLASGLGAVANIKSTSANVPKAAKGATLQGPSHAGGGITLYDQFGSPIVEAEGGENIHVLNKRASLLLNSLSHLNQATGGVPLSQATSYAAAGGMVRSRTQTPANIRIPEMDLDLLALKIADANRSLPPPRVAVEEINTGQGQLTRVVSGAII